MVALLLVTDQSVNGDARWIRERVDDGWHRRTMVDFRAAER